MKKGIYRHYKGNLYELVSVANHSETLEKMIVYRALYGEGEVWVRPAHMWDEEIGIDGKTQKRFEYIGDKLETEKSCGAIVWRKGETGYEFLVIYQKGSKTWSFPKGHMEKGEAKTETATREIFEEISCTPVLDDNFQTKVSYITPKGKLKHVYLFLAQINEDVSPCEKEIITYLWADKEKAIELLPKVGYVKILDDAEEYIKENY